MTTTIDARGLTCPAPVLLVKDNIENGDHSSLKVLVDNQASCENVTRFLTSQGFAVSESQENTDYLLEAILDGERAVSTTAAPGIESTGPDEPARKIAVLITGDAIGSGDRELGKKLMISYLKTIREMGNELWHLIFVNKGVTLTIDSSPVLEEIKEYEQSGVIVLACGTCLEHFGLTARKRVGGTTNMLDIVTATQLADKVITIG